ncbi:hypothetical protein GOBAR_DD15443 [Gossypium barbadense]|nr:hypothetical protein GOBAR_DD15443 [Gossypium barbadense]
MEKIYMVICIFMTSLVLAKSSKDGKPAASCCAGLEKVLKSNPDCICEYIKNNAQLGANINVTKAETLPSACQVSSPPYQPMIVAMAVSPSPGVAPASLSSDKGGAPSTKSPSTPPGGVPPPSSHHSGAYSLPAWFFASISMLAVSLSFMVL